MAHPDKGCYSANEVSSHKKTWRNLTCISLSARNQPEKAMDFMIDSTYMIFWKRQRSVIEKAKNSEKISDCQELGGGRDEKAEHRGLGGQGNYSV